MITYKSHEPGFFRICFLCEKTECADTEENIYVQFILLLGKLYFMNAIAYNPVPVHLIKTVRDIKKASKNVLE
jgi:hypothetical protein